MLTIIRRIGFLLFVSALLAMVGVGCNTVNGFGKDLRSVGRGGQGTGRGIDDERTPESGNNRMTDQGIQESRTAEGVAEGPGNTREGIQDPGQRIDGQGTAEGGYNQITDQGIEDSRTAERVREALAASVDYKYDGVKVTARDGMVQLSGFVNTSAQRDSAAEAAGKVLGAKSVENGLTIKN
jgi:osmotically-inducible protein OsmY